MDYLKDYLAGLASRAIKTVRELRVRDVEHVGRDAHERPRIVGRITVETRDARTGERIEHECGVTENIVPDNGLGELAKILTKYSPTVGYEIAVGTSSTAPAATDTGLGAEVFRAAVTSVSSASAVFTAKLFLDTTDANGSTLVEAGLFHNSVVIDHALITSVAKDATKTVTVQIDLTISR